MATVAEEQERECAVCTNEFTTPKILPCGHLLCRQCVISWMDSKPNAGCPLCTRPIVEHPGNSSQSSADVVDALPTDYVMEAIVKSSRVLGKGMCTVCDDVTAVSICMQCLEKMCTSCMKIHKKMVATRSHEVESLSTVTPERLAASRPALCADHGDKHAEMFCVRHNLVICTSCASNKHSDCPDVKYLDVPINSAQSSLDLMTEKLDKAEQNLKQAIGNLNVRVQAADVIEQRNNALVDKICDRLQKMVEECRTQLNKLINDSICKFKKSLYDVKSELEKRLGKVTSHKHIVTRATTVRPRPALIHAAKALTDRVNSLDLKADLEEEPWVSPSPQIEKHCDDVVKVMKAELHSLQLQRAGRQAQVLVFHEKCGSNIHLMNCNTTARIKQLDNYCNGVVVSRDAMAVDVLYEVRIDEINASDRNVIFLGLTEIPPAQLIVTTWSTDPEKSVIIWDSGVRRKGYKFLQLKSDVGKALNSIKVGSRVGLLVDSSNDLHLYVDGQDQGVATKDVAHPCFAVFDLSFVIQVTALPTSARKKSEADNTNRDSMKMRT